MLAQPHYFCSRSKSGLASNNQRYAATRNQQCAPVKLGDMENDIKIVEDELKAMEDDF